MPQVPNPDGRIFRAAAANLGGAATYGGNAMVDQRPVTDHATNIESQLESLGREIQLLTDRLNPIMAPEPPASGGIATAPEAPVGNSDLANRLHMISNQISRLQGMVNLTSTRIEI